MAAHQPHDEEAGDTSGYDGQDEHYHDDPDNEDTDAPITSDAPLITPSQRPSADFDGLHLGGHSKPTWKEQLTARIPPALQRACSATVTWVKGPNPPHVYSITPVFPAIQHAPLALLDRYFPKRIQKFALLLAFYTLYLLSFALILHASNASASIPGYGTPARLGCTARYWAEGNGCGLNGDRCRPFTNTTLAFRCPADCHKAQMLNPHAVGDQEVVYQPLVVGGPTDQQTGVEEEILANAVYRGDSFICASAIHAGFFPAAQGGCGVLTLTGLQNSFAASTHHGISSTAFDSAFPHSFAFLPKTLSTCTDLRWPALAISVFFTTLLSLFTTNPAIFYWTTFVALFFHVSLASDPPLQSSTPNLLSLSLGRFLPACFCAWVTYRYTVSRSLQNLTAQVEKSVLWLGAAWVGALNNYTFDRIPIQRLTPHDIQAQPGAIPALIAVVLTIFSIALGQAWSFRQEGRMPRYLALYGTMVAGLLVMLVLPGLSLRIHHYVLALLLLPGTSFQNRPSLLYQGLLVGLFVNGIARWGFDSILQTPGDLLMGVNEGSLLPQVAVEVFNGSGVGLLGESIRFAFTGGLPIWEESSERTFDGVSVLVNDVERFRGFGDAWEGEGGWSWTWKRRGVGRDEGDGDMDGDVEGADVTVLPQYFRFAYLAGSDTADYTKAGKWAVDGSWVEMEEGPS